MTDVFSWGDSSPEDPFDDDSWMSEPESICNNWRGWKRTTTTNDNSLNIHHIGYNNGSMASTSTTTTTTNHGHQNRYHHHHHLHLPSNSSGITTNRQEQQQTTSSTTNETIRRTQFNLPQQTSSSSSSYLNNINNRSGDNNNNNNNGSSTTTTNNPNQFVQSASASSTSRNHLTPAFATSSSLSTNQSENFLINPNNNDYNRISGIDQQQIPPCCMMGINIPPTLTELAARSVAYHISFEIVERVCSPLPEQLQLRIAYWSFPDNEEDIRLYSCLANGSADEFQKGETMYRFGSVHCVLQIGFHLSATVLTSTKPCTVAVTFDRCRITSCNCTCTSQSSWCSHVVAVCLYRIYQPNKVRLRAPVSESLTRLSRDQLQKFAQYLISKSPQSILPIAQSLLDDLLLNENSNINKVRGAPDPTAGAPANEQTKWCLDEFQLHENIRKIVIKLCIPSPMVYSDVNYLSSTAPPAASEWSSLLRPLRGREPEGLWNLLSIVREMLRRHDRNAIPLLRILTEELLSCDQILIWWFSTNVSLNRGCPPNSFSNNNNHHNGGGGTNHNHNGGGNGNSNSNNNNNNRSMHSNIYASQHACCSLCDEIVVLWRLIALNPAHSFLDTHTLYVQLKEYHLKTLSVIYRLKPSSAICYSNPYHFNRSSFRSLSSSTNTTTTNNNNLNSEKFNDLTIFSGFKPAMISCLINWDNYPIPGITNQKKIHCYYDPYLHGLHGQLNSTTINHSITSTLHFNDSMIGSSWPTTTSNDNNNNNGKSPSTLNCQQQQNHQSDQFSDTNSSGGGGGGGDNRKSRKTNKNRKSHQQQKQQQKDKDCEESDDSGNQDICWERYSVASSVDNDNDDGDKLDEPIPGPSGLQQQQQQQQHSSNDQEQQQAEESNDNNIVQQQKQISNNNDDDYQIYIYNNNNNNKDDNHQQEICQNSSIDDYEWDPILLQATKIKSINDSFEILFARAEALYAHGYVDEACRLSKCLAKELLANPPDLKLDLNNQNQNGELNQSTTTTANNQSGRNHTKRMNRIRFNPILHQISLLSSSTLSKAAFLCQVLSENQETHLLAFQIGLFGLELIRPPASTKALEVKLAHQEQELVNLLKKIPLCSNALNVLREKAEQLRDGRLTTRGEALLPLSLASYLFDAFLSSNQIIPGQYRLPTDERLLFDATVAAIGLKAKVSEAEHPLLCEGTRRQRGDLALQLLVHYKDNKQRLDLIMEKLLDLEIHPIFNSSKKQQQQQSLNNVNSKSTSSSSNVQKSTIESTATIIDPIPSSSSTKDSTPKQTTSKIITENDDNNNDDQQQQQSSSTEWNMVDEFEKFNIKSTPTAKPNDCSTTSSDNNSPTIIRRTLFHKSNSGSDSSSSSSSGSGNETSSSQTSETSSNDSLSTNSDCKKSNNNPNQINNSNDDNTKITITATDGNNDDDNSKCSSIDPKAGPSSSSSSKKILDSNSSGGGSSILVTPGPTLSTSSSSQPSTTTPSTCSQQPTTYQLSSSGSQQQQQQYHHLSTTAGPSSSTTNGLQSLKPLRYKGKRHYPIIPNQPSEASAHFMFELAKTLLAKAGGNNTTVLFTQPPSSQNCRSPHRLLHMCAFQIGLYALGLHNAVSPNWLSRTYSSHVSWITCQAMEIGHQAIEFLIDTWEGHLTPSEVASLADRASRSQESLMIKAAGELALSCLPHAHALTPSEIQRALIQCKEQNKQMLERAILSVEQAAQGGGVYPEVLFDVARKWFQLYIDEKAIQIFKTKQEMNINNNDTNNNDNNGDNNNDDVDDEYCTLDNNDLQSSSSINLQTSTTTTTTNTNFDPSRPDILHICKAKQEFFDSIDLYKQRRDLFRIPEPENIMSSPSRYYPMHYYHFNNNNNNNPMIDQSAYYYHNHNHHHHHYQSSPATSLFPNGQNIYSSIPDMNNPYLFYNPSQQQQQLNNNNNVQQSNPMANYYQPNPAILYDAQRGYHQNPSSSSTYQTTLIGQNYNPIQQQQQCNNNNNNRAQYYPLLSNTPLLSSPIVVNSSSSSSSSSGLTSINPVNNGTNQGSSNIGSNGINVGVGSSSMFQSNGNYFYPIANNSQQQQQQQPLPFNIPPPPPPSLHYITPAGNILPYPFISSFTPIQRFMPPNLMASQENMRQNFKVFVDHLAQYQPSSSSSSSSSSTNTNTNTNITNGNTSSNQMNGIPIHNHSNHHHHHHHSVGQQQQQQQTNNLCPKELTYLHAAYRVGMLAMEALARRVNDDRPQAKYARNPSYGEDVRWLLSIAKKLGTQYVQEYCLCALSAISSPFVLKDIIFDSNIWIYGNQYNNTAYVHTIRSHIITPLIHKCQMMFTSGIYFQLMNIASSDYDEFISTLRTARSVFQLIPGGNLQFNDLLHKLKRTKSCKKELWQQITKALLIT
uniref:Zinc finger SWIM domain-containing protein 8-like n=1 Tax=Dermatophagoides pteronyssinus TaxID=6956 RepID=A0A6P6YCU5_DERPT|nr:zinc finger SWIM domain-containing protein 8-like [Dermatophagoides pteronyssinus]